MSPTIGLNKDMITNSKFRFLKPTKNDIFGPENTHFEKILILTFFGQDVPGMFNQSPTVQN